MPVLKKKPRRSSGPCAGQCVDQCHCSDAGWSEGTESHAKSELVKKKAILLEAGEIYVPKDMKMPYFPSRSTAGPDAGLSSYTFEFRGTRVRMGLSKDPKSMFALDFKNGTYQITKNGGVFVPYAWVLPTLAHSPDQAFLNLASKCIYNCAFCAAPRLLRGMDTDFTNERVKKFLLIVSSYKNLNAFSLTSAVPDSASETNARLARAIKEIRKEFSDLPIGVEAHFEELADIKMFKKAGANEIKINIEAWPARIFRKVCPKRDQGKILAAMDEAVKVFGKGKVSSNLIIGLGETDQEVKECIELLARKGVVVNLRAIRVNGFNKGPLKKALGEIPRNVSATRQLRLGRIHRKILEQHSLSTKTFDTMCFPCQCCDIVPFYDL